MYKYHGFILLFLLLSNNIFSYSESARREMGKAVFEGRISAADKILDDLIANKRHPDEKFDELCSVGYQTDSNNDYGLNLLAFTMHKLTIHSYDKFIANLISYTPDHCLLAMTSQKRNVLHYAVMSTGLELENFKQLVTRLQQILGPKKYHDFLNQEDKLFRSSVPHLSKTFKKPHLIKELLKFEIIAPRVIADEPVSLPKEVSVPSIDWQARLEKILKIRDFSEFEDLNTPIGGTGAGDQKKLFKEKSTGILYIINSTWSGGAESAAIDAYAGVLYSFLLGKHSTESYFVRNGNEIYAAHRWNETFKDLFEIWKEKRSVDDILLPPGSGLAPIIVASMILGEIDLKGISADRSNIGIVGAKEREYLKIDHGQSFFFNHPGYAKNFDLTYLKDPQANMPYLESLGFNEYNVELPKSSLEEIKQVAKEFSQIPPNVLQTVLDFCEEALKIIDRYPVKSPLENDSRIGGEPPEYIPALLKRKPSSFKEAILERFEQLREAVR